MDSDSQDAFASSLSQWEDFDPVTRFNPLSIQQLMNKSAGTGLSGRARGLTRNAFHIRGFVVSISPYIFVDKPFQPAPHKNATASGSCTPSCFFFVELSNQLPADSMASAPSSSRFISTTVVFNGSDAIKWRPFLHLERQYVILNVKNRRLNPGTVNERTVVATTAPAPQVPGSGTHLFEVIPRPATTVTPLVERTRSLFSPRFFASPLSQSQPSSSLSQFTSPLNQDAVSDEELVSYTGEITNYFGGAVYELDNELRLYLSHYGVTHSEGLSLRLGCRINISNAHVVYVDGQLEGLALCCYGHIAMESFSSNASAISHGTLQEQISPISRYINGFSMPDAIWFERFIQLIQSKFGAIWKPSSLFGSHKSPKSGVLQVLLSALQLPSHRRNIYEEFMNHRIGCKLNRFRQDFTYPRIPTIQEFIRSITSESITEQWILIGVVNGNPRTGRLELSDQTGSVDLIVSNLLSVEDLGHIYQLGSYRIMSEPNGDNNTVKPVLVSNREDLICLFRQEPQQPAANSLFGSAHGFEFTVLRKYPVTSSLHNGEAQFHMEVTVTPTSPAAVIEFNGPAGLRWFPGLHAGGGYRVSGCDLQPLQMAVKELEPYQHQIPKVYRVTHDSAFESVSRLTSLLSDEETVVPIRSLLEWPLPCAKRKRFAMDNLEDLVHFKGIVIHREYRQSDHPLIDNYTRKFLFRTNDASGNAPSKIFLKIRDLDGPDSVDMYLDIFKFIEPRGLIPGAMVVVRRASRKMARSFNIYINFNAATDIEVVTVESPVISSTDSMLSQINRTRLIDLACSNQIVRSILKIQGAVSAVVYANFQWQCANCQEVVTLGVTCPRLCANGAKRFYAEASCVFDDGTADCQIHLNGDSVFELMRLPVEDRQKLEALCRRHGPLSLRRGETLQHSANAVASAPNRFIEDLLSRNTVKRPVVIYCKPFGKPSVDLQRPFPNGGPRKQTPAASVSGPVCARVCVRVDKVEEFDSVSNAYALLHTLTNNNTHDSL
eukprot:GILJ01011949.1.p1 GENE.GILJ01011949.1~~GILJ01011949.1.p1  ORF type:complete len:1148 (-),score=153.98 GILJ01011949.1:18-3023(-)